MRSNQLLLTCSLLITAWLGVCFGARAQVIEAEVGLEPPVMTYSHPPPPPATPPPPPPAAQPMPAPAVQPPPPPPRTVLGLPPSPRRYYPYEYAVIGAPRLALHGRLGAILSDKIQMGGGTVALRLRPRPRFAVDFGIGAYGGRDYNELDRAEVPLTADGLFYFNPQDQFQLYGLAGVGLSFSHVNGFDVNARKYVDRDYSHFGGQVGVGGELRASPQLAFNADIRFFLRGRLSGGPEPEFVERDKRGQLTGRTTNTSGGTVLSLGATLYLY